ncbi:lysophospholipid acyltransferase family protein [Flagellimonas zhangzhouensis]|uniref:KDO2-lipid IV(A) lauroyltransferase n=1 Tax=Flagellimonas zhangzhouensis TaxID=1073328 RepID=A0A1H2SCK6_9FLAO|nr:lipid A biosynthesis acyltransferase [Allomuricauda zhangzhouensis]SDQ73375.1 KDO2-lipid IV(A) lauroyltransferase [Allomuricauda zhangzhouensis]SDW29386.1 KDO2-lipid IV(A) lauroyltransferase [Allomuricauda zhangzhouensis]
MQLVVYILVYPLLWLISRLPFKVIYFISDGVYALLYYVIGYRKKVVRNNLALVFPEKSKEERLAIEKKFYKHMCDMFLEMIKTMGISKNEIQKRFTVTNIEVLHDLEAKGINTMLMLPHYASWEWVLSLNLQIKSKGYGIYQKIQNKYFDKMIRDIRSKFNTQLISTKESRKILKAANESKELSMVGIISDQSPMVSRAKYWTEFMGITVPAHVGGEEICKHNNFVPVYLKVEKLKRGYYQGTFKVLFDDPTIVPDYKITDAFLKETEKSILEAPEYYFWTHKRWKHKDKVPKKFQKELKAVKS